MLFIRVLKVPRDKCPASRFEPTDLTQRLTIDPIYWSSAAAPLARVQKYRATKTIGRNHHPGHEHAGDARTQFKPLDCPGKQSLAGEEVDHIKDGIAGQPN